MFYSEFVKQATDLAGITSIDATAIDPTVADKAFSLLQTSLLSLNTDDRLTFAVDDISLDLHKPKLVFLQKKEIEDENDEEEYLATPETLALDEQAYFTDYPVEIPPAYVIGNDFAKMQKVSYENYLTAYRGNAYCYAFRLDYNKATLHFRYTGELKIGLKKPLDVPQTITDEVKLTGSALNLLKYKLATELMALYGMPQNPAIEQKYSEYMQRHLKIKGDILPPPVLNPGCATLRRY